VERWLERATVLTQLTGFSPMPHPTGTIIRQLTPK
jgi:hypothetical protein